MTITDDFVKQLQEDYDNYMNNPEAIKYIFHMYRNKIDNIPKHDFRKYFTADRLLNEDTRIYCEGLELYQERLHDYIAMLRDQDSTFLETAYENDNIEKFFGSPLILTTTLREKIDILKELFNPDEFIIINAIAEINLRYNKLEETLIQIKSLDLYTKLWAPEGEHDDPLRPFDATGAEHFHPLQASS
tara:strand:+ start:1085 stop:1648 length:564 start_codon:yes stop_codon:yes gene_type:complete